MKLFALLLLISLNLLGKELNVALFYIGAASPGAVLKNGHTEACAAIQSQIERENEYRKNRGEEYIKLNFIQKNINDFSLLSTQELIKNEEKYIKMIKNDKEMYSKIYAFSKRKLNEMDPLFVETYIDLKKLSDFLEGKTAGSKKVDIVYGAHWLIPLAIVQANYAGRILNSRVAWVFTDYYENPLFPKISQCIDGTFLGARSLVQHFTSLNVEPKALYLSGIPVNPYSRTAIDKTAFLKRKGMSTSPTAITITLAGGGEGLGNFPQIVKSIREKFLGKRLEIQLVAITAKNEKHYQDLTALKNEWEQDRRDDFKLFIEQVISNEDMLDYVKVSKVYIVKSGGLSPTEGVMIGTPLILLDVLGGHEEDNLDFYNNAGVALINRNAETIGDQVWRLLFDKEKIRKITQAQREFRFSQNLNSFADFTLNNSSNPKKLACIKKPLSSEALRLLKEVGLGRRDELHFLKMGWPLLEAATKGDKAKIVEAEEVFKKILIMDPTSYSGHYMMAHVLHLKGNTQGAIEHLNKSIEFDPTQGMEGQVFLRGVHQLNLKNVEAGIKDLWDSLQLEKKHQGSFAYGERQKKALKEYLISSMQAKDLEDAKKILAGLIRIEEEMASFSNYVRPAPQADNTFKVTSNIKQTTVNNCEPGFRVPPRLLSREMEYIRIKKTPDGYRAINKNLSRIFLERSQKKGGGTLKDFIFRQTYGSYPGAVDMMDEKFGRNALHWAIVRNHPEEVIGYLTYSLFDPFWMDINSRTHAGETPLILAVKTNRLKFVQYLLRAGADREIKFKGKNALQIARQIGNKEMVRLLEGDGGNQLETDFWEMFLEDNIDDIYLGAQKVKLCPFLKAVNKL